MTADVDNIPHAEDIEIGVLGCIMSYKDALKNTINIFSPKLFYKESHYMIANAMLNLHKRGDPIDLLTVANKLKQSGELDIITPVYLTEISSKAILTSSIEYHVRILHELWIRREIDKICYDYGLMALDMTKDILDTLAKLDERIDSLSAIDKESITKSLKSLVDTEITELLSNEEGSGKKFILKTGNNQFDKKIALSSKDILLVGGKSGSGKTRFITSLMKGALELSPNNISILWCNMEDPIDKMLRCFLSAELSLTDSQLKQIDYKLTELDKSIIAQYKDKFSTFDIDFIDHTEYISTIKNAFKYFCKEREEKLNILIIDNIMLLKDNSGRRNQTEIDDEIARRIKEISEETHGLIIMLHHFTDEQLSKTNIKDAYRPRESHLKGSTRYRDISTKIVLINKPSNYPDLMAQYKHLKDIINYLLITDIAKNRNATTGCVRWFASLGLNKFTEIKET